MKTLWRGATLATLAGTSLVRYLVWDGVRALDYLIGRDDVDAERRAALHRLAWDFVGSGLGTRGDLYERNYLASARTNRMLGHIVYADRTRAYRLVDDILAVGRSEG